MAGAFQVNAFQNTAFQVNAVTSSVNLPFPINCVLAGQQLYEKSGSIFEPARGKGGRRVIASAGAGGRLSGDAPSFSVTSNRKGY